MVLGGQNDPTSLFVIGGVATFQNGSFGSGLGYVSELFPTVIRGTAYGSASFFGGILAVLSPAIIGRKSWPTSSARSSRHSKA